MIHRLLKAQIEKAGVAYDADNPDPLVKLVSASYHQFDLERKRTAHSTRMMIEEIETSSQEREAILQGLKLERDKLNAALENMSHGLAMFDGNGKLMVCNTQYRQLLGLEDAQPGADFSTLKRSLLAQLAGPATRLAEVPELMRQQETLDEELVLQDGRVIDVLIKPLQSGGWVEVYRDMSAEHQAHERIRFLASHDLLTELPNRAVFNERMERVLQQDPEDRKLAVMFIDLDNFKLVNDTFGHPLGDMLLQHVARRLKSQIRPGDVICRLGGDEFAILINGIQDAAKAGDLAQRIVNLMAEPFEIDGHKILIGASVGISMSPNDGLNPHDLVRRADMALYKAKHEGKRTFQFYEAILDEKMQARHRLEMDLRQAIKAGEFELHYQPVVNTQTQRVTSFEALVRWRHPERGLVPPLSFIPLAEEIGLIKDIGKWVVRKACEDAARWPDRIGVAVNLSAMQFQSPAIALEIMQALEASRLAPARLSVEITESLLLQDTERTLGILHALRRMGVKIVMDDFGTGFSSINYLRKFPFDALKIDKSFIHDVVHSESARAIVRAVTQLAKSLGIKTIAEGVENRDQPDVLKALQCDEMQGYLISRPLPVQQINEIYAGPALAQQKSPRAIAGAA